MDYTVAFDAPPDRIYRDLTSREYWEALVEVYQRFTPSDIVSFTTDELGTDVEFIHELPRSDLPTIARHAIRTDVVVTRRQHYDPYDDARNRATGTYSASIPRAPGRFGGQHFLTETDTGTQLRFASVCKVWVPLVGGAVEDLILSNITDLFEGEREFTADWIVKRQ